MNNTEQNLCKKIDEKDLKPMIFIEGNVGVGKSTFLRLLHEKLGLEIFYEPIELWQNIQEHNLLQQFFKDQHRWAYTFQSYLLMTRIDQMIFAQKTSNQVCCIERSVYADRYCFASVAKDIGTINDLEWSLYTTVWKREMDCMPQFNQGFIYLRTSAQVCYERISKRGRQEENPITMDYLKRLEEKHERWFVKKEFIDKDLVDAPVLILDFSKDFYQDEVLQANYINQVKDFIEKVTKRIVKK